MTDRRQDSYRIRVEAAALARGRNHPSHQANGDEQRYAHARYAMSFTKGLEHDRRTGLIRDAEAFEAFRSAIDDGYSGAFTLNVPIADVTRDDGTPESRRRQAEGQKERAWEAPTAGVVFDLQGPDAQAVTMAPAPALGSAELAYEMAEVYELALLRDVPLSGFSASAPSPQVQDTVTRLNNLSYTPDGSQGRPRTLTPEGNLTPGVVFRGSSPGVADGPYLSQFLLLGTDVYGLGGGVGSGLIDYGVMKIDQRVPTAPPTDYMTTRADWLRVQNGADTLDPTAIFTATRRFITTPRDLASYVHFDALYQAYLNACLILLAMGTPFDPGFARLSGQRPAYLPSASRQFNNWRAPVSAQAGGFALYGGPHILTLVTEVATRALKAVRYQKFNVHLRLRPEALAGRIEYRTPINNTFPQLGAALSALHAEINATVSAVEAASGSALLPMAFPEGSPMHPAYGAGHATVAGACVTILKAFFDTGAVLVERGGSDAFRRLQGGDQAVHYIVDPGNNAQLSRQGTGPLLTLEGELNKLAANISIGRNMAGVHYYTDYYDSLRMGEQIAIGLLEEQALCYPTDRFVLSVPTFDGGVRRIGAR